MKKKKKGKVIGKITTIVAITAFVASFIGFTYVNLSLSNETSTAQASETRQIASSVEGIQPELVCMVNDAYMGKKQIPVPVGERTYYGCCQMCVGKLQGEVNFRTAKDPATGETVDKSQAFIALQPGSDSEVLYFKTEANFHQYRQARK
uniref:Uncharacterized protein n=1 Tax=Roseihalotalea indica TaxID=2867963 RepID=A0AA49JH83_9BACT|nr:hypothetical protein K4G66_07800 [Tunicatimonas sp. TK19036]